MPFRASPAHACSQPAAFALARAFNLAADGLLPASYPQLPGEVSVASIPPSILEAIGWVESGWHQFTPAGRPLVSFDFGYGVMQITSGMAGAFGKVDGDLAPATQSRIASDYIYNIAYGARMLAEKWSAVPMVGTGDPSVIEDWYYAIWAYNGWGWVNNPNNPRFRRIGTPASNPASFPYQERVLYLVAHPPRDQSGNLLWQPIPVALPSRKAVGLHPGPLPDPIGIHAQLPPSLASVYQSTDLPTVEPAATLTAAVHVSNVGTSVWPARGSSAVTLTYHILSRARGRWRTFARSRAGVYPTQGVAALPHDMAPGKMAMVHASVHAPPNPGRYRVVWDLREGPDLLFSSEGSRPLIQPLEVRDTPPATSTPLPTSTPSAIESLQYIADTSLPDGSPVAPGQMLQKGWLVFNNGRTDWSPDWMLERVSGSSMSATTIAVPSTTPCHTVNIVLSLRAPSRPGTYTSMWQLVDPNGQRVGDHLTAKIVVGTGTPTPIPTPTGSATPVPSRTPSATPTVTSTG